VLFNPKAPPILPQPSNWLWQRRPRWCHHAQQDPSDRFKGGEIVTGSLRIFGKWREKGETARESQTEGRAVNACCCHECKLISILYVSRPPCPCPLPLPLTCRDQFLPWSSELAHSKQSASSSVYEFVNKFNSRASLALASRFVEL